MVNLYKKAEKAVEKNNKEALGMDTRKKRCGR